MALQGAAAADAQPDTMAKFWKEPLDPDRHRDFMVGFVRDGGEPVDSSNPSEFVYFVRECGFTFQFVGLDQLEVALDYFSRTTHPSSREPNDGLEHWYHRWFERLPPGLTSGSKRVRIEKALRRALDEFGRYDAG